MCSSDARSEAKAGFAPGLIVSMSSAGYSSASWSPAALASASPDDSYGETRAGTRQPPLGKGWGIFSWRKGEFSVGVAEPTYGESRLVTMPSAVESIPKLVNFIMLKSRLAPGERGGCVLKETRRFGRWKPHAQRYRGNRR